MCLVEYVRMCKRYLQRTRILHTSHAITPYLSWRAYAELMRSYRKYFSDGARRVPLKSLQTDNVARPLDKNFPQSPANVTSCRVTPGTTLLIHKSSKDVSLANFPGLTRESIYARKRGSERRDSGIQEQDPPRRGNAESGCARKGLNKAASRVHLYLFNANKRPTAPQGRKTTESQAKPALEIGKSI